MWSYLHNQQSKHLVYLQFLTSYAFFSKNWCRKLFRKNLEYENILYNSTELPVDWTCTESQIQTILLPRNIKSSVSHNPEVTVSVSYTLLVK